MSNPEQLFNSLRLEVIVPDEVIQFPESADSTWIRKLEALGERPAAYFDERLQFYLVARVGSKPAGGAGPTPPLYLLNFLVYLQVAIDAIYVPSYTPASGRTSPRPPAKLSMPQGNSSMLNIPAHSSPLKNPVHAARPAPVQPPETPNPLPMTSESERVLGRTDMGVPVQSYFWGEENDGQRKIGVQDGKPSFRLFWLPEEDSWAMIYRFEITVEYLRVRMQDPVLCLTVSATLRDKPMFSTPQREELIELFKSAGGVYQVVKSKSKPNGSVPPKDQEVEDDVMYGLEEVNLLEGLTDVMKVLHLLPKIQEISYPYRPLAWALEFVGRHSLLLQHHLAKMLLHQQCRHNHGTPLSNRPLPTLRKAFRKTLPTASGIQVRLLPAFVPHAFTDDDFAEHDEATGEEHSVVLSIELENPGGQDSGFLVEKVQVTVNGEDTQTRLLGSTTFPYLCVPEINITSSKQDMSSQDAQDLGMRTKPFDARWHCPLDLFAMSQQSSARSNRPQSIADPASVDLTQEKYRTPHSASNPLAGPFSGVSITPDGSSLSSVFGTPVELPSATSTHSINQRASTPVIVPPGGLPRPGTSQKFVPMPPSMAISAGLTPPPGTTAFIQSQAQGTPTKGSPTTSSHGGLAVPSSGPTPVTPAFPAYPDVPLPLSPLSQAPAQGLMAAIAPSLEPTPRRDSLSRQDSSGRRDSLSHRDSMSDPLGLGQRRTPYPPVLQPVLVSVSLLPPDGSSDERIYPMNTFSLEIFVFNESDVVRRCEISCPARKRWRQEAAQRSQDDHPGNTAGILPLENHIRIGPLRPGTCQSVRMRFLAIQPGSHSVDTLTLTDVETGYAINLRDTVNVVVHKREEATSQAVTPSAEISVSV
ncbi:TRAPP trafficking subunit Trs65-domain-containing protein [Rhizoctonia solani]|nr:TRAPP trafficking subunit Trs65-domain-containing protein [Rhizoctonia solani]